MVENKTRAVVVQALYIRTPRRTGISEANEGNRVNDGVDNSQQQCFDLEGIIKIKAHSRGPGILLQVSGVSDCVEYQTILPFKAVETTPAEAISREAISTEAIKSGAVISLNQAIERDQFKNTQYQFDGYWVEAEKRIRQANFFFYDSLAAAITEDISNLLGKGASEKKSNYLPKQCSTKYGVENPLFGFPTEFVNRLMRYRQEGIDVVLTTARVLQVQFMKEEARQHKSARNNDISDYDSIHALAQGIRFTRRSEEYGCGTSFVVYQGQRNY
jgi:hypothetical protein